MPDILGLGCSSHWRMQDGTLIKPSDMKDGHLRNTIHFIERGTILAIQKLIGTYMGGPEPQGEMAAMAFNEEFDTAMEADWRDYLPKIYHRMKAEARKRKLPDPSYTEAEALAIEMSASLIVLDKVISVGRKRK